MEAQVVRIENFPVPSPATAIADGSEIIRTLSIQRTCKWPKGRVPPAWVASSVLSRFDLDDAHLVGALPGSLRIQIRLDVRFPFPLFPVLADWPVLAKSP